MATAPIRLIRRVLWALANTMRDLILGLSGAAVYLVVRRLVTSGSGEATAREGTAARKI